MRRAPTAGTSEAGLNDLVAQLEFLGGHLYTHNTLMRDLLATLPPARKTPQVVDYFRSTAGPDNPTGMATSLTFPLGWIPAVARISTIVYAIGGTAVGTLQIGKRIYPVQVGANIPTPASLPLSPDGGLVVYPQDVIKLFVPTTPVILSLELIGELWDHAESHQVFA